MLMPLSTHFLRAAAITTVLLGSAATSVEAGVVVVCNRTASKVEFSMVRSDGKSRTYSLDRGDLVPVPVKAKSTISYQSKGATRRHVLDVNSVYFFLSRKRKLDLVKISFGPLPDGATPPANGVLLESAATIPVMILVDDDEPAVQRIWERRLKERLAEASEIFEQHCWIRFEPVAVGTWTSDNSVVDFAKSLREFELKVTPAPARLAIGFTSQYKFARGQVHLGGTRGALRSHILIREWAHRISKPERLEVLLHELGHFLGATHSPEANSAMRPKVGDHRSNARSFRIGFDPANTLIMNLVAEELRTRQIRSLAQLRPSTKAQLDSVYAGLAQVMPEDPSTKHFRELLQRSPSAKRQPVDHSESLVKATRVVVRAIATAARESHSAAAPSNSADLSGDHLTEMYVRRAAAAAGRLPSDQAAEGFLLGLGIALDRTSVLRHTPLASQLCRRVELPEEAAKRLAVLGTPTMHGQRDLAQHFAVSCALTTLMGPDRAETIGITKELADSRIGTGFSFVDLSADLAGIAFATHVREEKIALADLAGSFAVADYFPERQGLEEGIAWSDFLQQYGSAHDDRFRRQRATIRERILASPGYARSSQSRGE